MADVSTALTIHLAVFDFPGIPYSTHLIRDWWRSKTESNLPHDIADREHNITVSQIIRWWHSENMIKIKWYKIRLIFNEHIDGLVQDCNVTSLVECYETVLAIIMSVPENVWDECYRTCSRYLHKCYWGY